MKKIFSIVALAFVACSALVVTSCGDDNSSNSGSYVSTEDDWCTSDGYSYSGKDPITYTLRLSSKETIASVKVYYGKSTDVEAAYNSKNPGSLASVTATQSDDSYSYTLSSTGLSGLVIKQMVVVTSTTGKVKYFTPFTVFDRSENGMEVKIDTTWTISTKDDGTVEKKINVTVNGKIDEEAKSTVTEIALFTVNPYSALLLTYGYPETYITKLVPYVSEDGTVKREINSDGTFTSKFTITASTRSGQYVVVGGYWGKSVLSSKDEFQKFVWDRDHLLNIPTASSMK